MSNNDGLNVKIIAPFYENCLLKSKLRMNKIGLYVPDLIVKNKITQVYNKRISQYYLNYYNPQVLHETYYTGNYINCKAKRVITIHDLFHEIEENKLNYAEKIVLGYKRLAINRADHIICVSENTKKDLMNYYSICQSMVSVVYHGVSKSLHKTGEFFIEPKKPYLLYVGRRSGNKNFTGLLQAYLLLLKNKYQIDLVCFGGGDFTSREISYINHLGLERKNVLHISGNDTLLAHYYSRAVAFVYPSFYEGFGFPLLEAMQNNCPVICSNTGALPEIAYHAAEYFDPYNSESMMSSISNVILSTEKRNTLIREGQRRILRFSWDKCALDTVKVYWNI